MNVPTITMDPDVAREKLRHFRTNRHADAEEVYRSAAIAYEALAEGTPLLLLSQAIRAGGYFPDMRPKLAVARADRREVWFHWRGHQTTARYFAGAFGRSLPANAASLEIHVDMGREHGVVYEGQPFPATQRTVHGYALVPMVPADVRPRHGQLREWFVLWEVGKWFDHPKNLPVPHDPLLLKSLGGDLYAVLAQWDLTEIERLVLEEVRR